jgi:hypothetical protein
MVTRNRRTLAADPVTMTGPVPDQHDATAHPMNSSAARAAVIGEVGSWEGVSVREHRFGGVEFRVDRRELGHLHATFADLPFPRRIRDELIAAGRAQPHHILPESGWVTVPMRTVAEVSGVIELFRRNYDRSSGANRGGATKGLL